MEGQNPCTRFKSKSMEVFWVFTQPRPTGARQKDAQALSRSKSTTACSNGAQWGLGLRPIGIPFGHFVFDACANGQKLKCLTLIDEFTKESLRIDVAGSIKGKRVVQVLEEVIAQRGYPKVLRSDNVLNARTFSSDRQSHTVTAICS